jgi:hypothetical protein
MQPIPQQKAQNPKKASFKRKDKEKVPSTSSGVYVEPLLDETTLQGLDYDACYFYQILTMQPFDKTLKFKNDEDMFSFVGDVDVFVTNIIELLRNEWLTSQFFEFSTCKNFKA